jgi:transcriptional regulator with XRE-family HTH domain
LPKDHDYLFLADLGRRLVNRRESLNLSQTQVALKSGITPQQMSRYELGLSDPPLSTLLRIAKALRLNPTALLVQVSTMEPFHE